MQTASILTVLFWKSNESYLAIPKSFFFKARWKTYDFDRSIEQLTMLLNKMGEAYSLHNNAAHIAYNTNKYAEA